MREIGPNLERDRERESLGTRLGYSVWSWKVPRPHSQKGWAGRYLGRYAGAALDGPPTETTIFIPSRPALTAQLLSIKQGSHALLQPPARCPFSQGRWTPPPISTIAKAMHVDYRGSPVRWRQVTFLTPRWGVTHTGTAPRGARKGRRRPLRYFVCRETHRVSLIPSCPGNQALRGGKHTTNGRWRHGCPRRARRATKGFVVWDGTPSGSNQPTADCRRMRSTAEKTRGYVDGQANLVDDQMRPEMRQCHHWEASETPKYVPLGRNIFAGLASISSIHQAWLCHTAICAPAAQPLKLACFQGCCLRNDPLEMPSSTTPALTAAHIGVAEHDEVGKHPFLPDQALCCLPRR